MPYEESVAERVRQVLPRTANVREIKMMGALIFMVDGHMCCGVSGNRLMVRVGAEAYQEALKQPHVGPLDVGGGRKPDAFVSIEEAGFATRVSLEKWTTKGLKFVGTLPGK